MNEQVLSGVYTSEKTVNSCHCRWQLRFEKVGNIQLNLQHLAK